MSLQKGPREHEIDTSGASSVMLDVGRLVNDFSGTAAVIEELDLVIMTDKLGSASLRLLAQADLEPAELCPLLDVRLGIRG